MRPAADDERHLRRAIELAQLSREHGNHPFGSVLVDGAGAVVLEAENTVLTGTDATGHAELNLVRAASGLLDAEALASHTLYASTEPCAMCAGAIFWAGIGRVVYALGSDAFQQTIDPGGRESLLLQCRDVFARGGRAVEVSGPQLEDEAWAVHAGFWSPDDE